MDCLHLFKCLRVLIVHSNMRLTALLSMAAKAAFPHDYRYGTNRPWTIAAQRLNPPGKKRRKVFVEPVADEDWHVVRGDTVSDPSCLLHLESISYLVDVLFHF